MGWTLRDRLPLTERSDGIVKYKVRGLSLSSAFALPDVAVDPASLTEDEISNRKWYRRKEKYFVSGESYSDALTKLSKVTINRPPVASVVKSKTSKVESNNYKFKIESVSR